MRISDWSSDVCSSDLAMPSHGLPLASSEPFPSIRAAGSTTSCEGATPRFRIGNSGNPRKTQDVVVRPAADFIRPSYSNALTEKPDFLASGGETRRSEEHTSELQSLMRISYAVFCLKKNIINKLLLVVI